MTALPTAARLALDEILSREDPRIVGVVLTGSAARGMATRWSDVDVYVVRTEDTAQVREVRRSTAVDEIPVTLTQLERPGEFGTDEWWSRWSFAWAKVLRDQTGGRVAAAVHRQATLTTAEQELILPDRLDGYVNFAYRALKADREGRQLERRLDAAESVPWLLDVVFTLAARVRPYNKYLSWELREHPLPTPEWSAERLLPQVEAMLAGDPDALRRTFASVERECLAYDADREHGLCRDTIESWGSELDLLHQRRW